MKIARTTNIGMALFATILFLATGAASRADGLDDILGQRNAVGGGLVHLPVTSDKFFADHDVL